MNWKTIKTYVLSFLFNSSIIYFGYLNNIEWVQNLAIVFFIFFAIVMIIFTSIFLAISYKMPLEARDGVVEAVNKNPEVFNLRRWKIIYSFLIIILYGVIGAWTIFFCYLIITVSSIMLILESNELFKNKI